MNNNEILLIFDLDFTLIDNREGIINSFNHAMVKNNYSKLDSSEIASMIGEPLEEMFSKYVKEDIQIFVKSFRDYYREKGIKELEFLPGAREKIIELFGNGFNLAILTLKKEELAKILIKNEGLTPYFKIILGSTKERRKKNSPKLKELLKNVLPEIRNYLMIGDHPSDGQVSELLKCPFIGLLSGKSTKVDLLKISAKKKIILTDIRELNSKMINELITK